MSLVVVVATGATPVAVPDGTFVIAADGGADAGLRVDLAVGDFDSVSASGLAAAGAVERQQAEKDATDLELALDAALRHGASRVLVLASATGRLDHLLGSLLLLASSASSRSVASFSA